MSLAMHHKPNALIPPHALVPFVPKRFPIFALLLLFPCSHMLQGCTSAESYNNPQTPQNLQTPQTPNTPATPQTPPRTNAAAKDNNLDAFQPILRAYEVAPPHQERTRSMLVGLLQRGENEKGRVVRGPGNQLVVLAPASVHEGIQTLLQDLESAQELPPPTALNLEYWIVLGTSASKPTIPTPLHELSDTLQTLQKTQGPMEFKLLEKVSLGSLDSEFARINGRWVEVEQLASLGPRGVTADLTIKIIDNKLQTRVQLQPQQIAALAQTNFDFALVQRILGKTGEIQPTPREYTLYYIVRAAQQ